MRRDLGSLSTTAVGERVGPGAIALLPIGAIEQHGPHLPLATDLITAEALARAVAEQFGEELDLWLLPAVGFSKSNEHTWAPGTISLTTATLLGVLDDVGRSLARTPIRRLAILNGHGGNSSLLDVACRDIRVAHGLMTFLLHTILPPEQGGPVSADELGLGIHAGQDETSLMLHLAPETVDMASARRTIPEWLNTYRHVTMNGPVRFGWTAEDITPSGVMGDPTLSSAEEGKSMFENMVGMMREQLLEVAAFEFGQPSRLAGAEQVIL